ncbi:DOT1-domain-containing protein [Auriscalpium vulgare]|uniref:DOT1-domain-containing protein n=1 Tax=Auriscalpium vulgare TaxID=40419 RepID=A0ACB8REN5_9AGAM|nr:DOT1-domain-containing protein [Auriscalpium vulgare]
MVVRPLMASYKAHFVNSKDPTDLSFQPHLTRYPVAELEFPNSGATERYILLSPKDPDHYDPIKDLFRTLYVILDTYLTREQRAVFGTLPDDPAAPDGSTNHLATLRRAYMQKNGPLFQSTMLQINALIRTFKYPPLPDDLFSPPPENAFKAAVRGWNPTGLPRALALRIMEETYQRVVGPHTNELKRYTAFSSQTYGELTPALVAKLIAQTRLGPGSLFLDLGSGVGNVAIQAALQAGSSAFGVEMMPGPADLAREQRRQMAIRTRMWGINMGDVELEQGDMLNSARVTELMGKADVVLVNNKVFKESLNEAIRPKFLDLKEGAIVVSLQPFVASLNARLTERNLDDLSAIFDVSEHTYQPMDVSWSAVAGSYYVHRVDREGYAAIRAQFERGQQRAGSARGTRARR